MADSAQPDATDLVSTLVAGEGEGWAVSRLMPVLYEELRSMAGRQLAHERLDHTLPPTALVHEAYLRLVDQSKVDWKGRTHFIAVAATVMRRILVDHARAKAAKKRGFRWCRITLQDAACFTRSRELDILALEDALGKLTLLNERQARIIELRFFGGLTIAETTEMLCISHGLVEQEWRVARAWLHRELS